MAYQLDGALEGTGYELPDEKTKAQRRDGS